MNSQVRWPNLVDRYTGHESAINSVTMEKLHQNPSQQNLSAQWRIAGKSSQRGQAWVVLLHQQG